VEQYASLLKLFEAHLASYTGALSEKKPQELYGPENYILSLGGKRLRPLLALIACDLFGSDPSKALPSALAVELFHNFSLIHDDILDDAPLRRNKPTVHEKWSRNIAILSGDVMLVKAYQCLEKSPPEQFIQLQKLLSQTAVEVCEGQQEDMNFETQQDVSVEDYLGMICRKTAVLLGCSLRMGAVTAGAALEDQLAIYEFGKELGIAFQLLDDHLDAFATDTKKFGKLKGGDIITNKKTFLLLKALELASPENKKEILLCLENKNASEKVHSMLEIFTRLQVDRLSAEEANRHTQKAVMALERIKADQKKKEALRSFAVGLLQRQS
jgi:geranylgeranyl diphosphate synthase type II